MKTWQFCLLIWFLQELTLDYWCLLLAWHSLNSWIQFLNVFICPWHLNFYILLFCGISLLYQTSRSCATARPAVIDSGGPSSIVKSPNIRCFVAKSGLSRFTRFLGVRFSAFDSNKYCQIGQWCYYYWFDIDSQSVLSIANLFYQ